MDRNFLDRSPIDRTVAGTNPPVPVVTYPPSQVCVLLYNDTDSMLVFRNPWVGCSLYFMSPKTIDSLDKIGTATFQLLDIGDSTATEKSLMEEGTNVAMILGRAIVYTGVVRRATQNLQSGFGTTTRVRQWNIECDSDLYKLTKVNVDSSALTLNGQPLYSTPGLIARLILTPAAGTPDHRGNIYDDGSVITYQLNSTSTESVGDQYTHLMNLQTQTNYDLRSRPVWYYHTYDSFSVDTLTVSVATWTANEFVDAFILFYGTDAGVVAYGRVTANTGTTITCDMVGASEVTASSEFSILNGYWIDFVPNLSQAFPIKNYNINKDVFNFSDNDDKRKLSTKMIVGGKDINGKTISVSVSGIHAFDETTKFYENSAYIDHPSEGYVHSNTYLEGRTKATFEIAVDTNDSDILQPYIGSTDLIFGGVYTFAVNDPVWFHALYHYGQFVPAPLSGYKFYYITAISYTANPGKTTVSISETVGGTIIKVYPLNTGEYCSMIKPACIIADNSKGKYKMSSEVMFYAHGTGHLPTGIVHYQKYYVNIVVPMANPVKFPVRNLPNWPYPNASVGFLNDAIAPTEVMLYIATVPTAEINIYGWGYQYISGDVVMLITPGIASYTSVSIIGTPTEFVASDGSLCTKLIVNENADGDYANKGFLISENISVKDSYKLLDKITTYFWTDYYSGDHVTIKTSHYLSPYYTVGSTVYFIAQTGETLPPPLVAGTPYYILSNDFANPTSHITISATLGGAVLSFTANGSSFQQAMYIGTDPFDVIMVGEEPITVRSYSSARFKCFLQSDRATSPTVKRYPHGVGAMVAKMDYTETSPQPGSPIALYKLRVDTRTVDNNVTYGLLDAYATSLLLGLGNFYKMATAWGPALYVTVSRIEAPYQGVPQPGLAVPPRAGDLLTFTEYVGATSVEYQAVAVSIDFDQSTVKLELGDFEKNVFTSLQQSTNAVNRTVS